MVFDMSSDHGLWATFLDAAITSDDVVIPNAVRIASGSVPFVDLLGAACLFGLDSRAVDDQ